MSKIALKTPPLWTAIITPMQADGSIHFPSLEKLLRDQDRVGNGVVLLGSTGEGLALSLTEKKSIVQFACGLNLSIPLIAGIPGHQLEDAVEWIKFAQEQGIQGFLSVVPYYAKPGPMGQVSWFKRILDTSQLPVMIYNVPSRTGIKLHAQVLQELGDHPNFWAVKESSGSVEEFKQYKALKPNLSFFCGDDALMPSFAKEGAVGLVSVASNIWPAATRRYVELSLAGKTDGLLPLWKDCTDALFLASNPIPTKFLHHHVGDIPTCLTRAPLDFRDLKNTDTVIQAHQKIGAWNEQR